jgi:transposase
VRVSTAFNRILQIPGANVVDVIIGDREIEVTVRLKARSLRCPCGKRFRAGYDRRRRRWRHVDLACKKLWLVYDIRRVNCSGCGVVTEQVPWARPGARFTRDFEDTVLWLAQRTDRTTVATLMRCGWESVTAIINRGVDELLDQRRLTDLYRIGVDEICYRHPHKYLTIVGNHDTGTVIDVQPGRSEQSLTNFYEQQPDPILKTITAVSMDVSKAFRGATRTHLPETTICFDPFHIMQWVNRALDRVFAAAAAGPDKVVMTSAQWRQTRWKLRTGENKLNRPGSGGVRDRTRRMWLWLHRGSSTRRPVSGPFGCIRTGSRRLVIPRGGLAGMSGRFSGLMRPHCVTGSRIVTAPARRHRQMWAWIRPLS